MRKLTFLMALVMLSAFQLAAQTALVPFGSTWKYLDNGSNQGTAWRAVSYDDASWKSGPAVLGYGNPDSRKETTTVSFGPDPDNTYITTYFRKTISLASAFTSFSGKVKRDDGAVVYVNGVEVYRSNMPGSTIAYNSLASYALDNGTQPQSFTINGSAFTTGSNVIAVEVHQHSKTSSDMTFDLELVGTGEIPTGDQTAPTVLSLNRQSPATETTDASTVVFRATFSEAVTGVDAADFQLAGTAGGTIASVAADAGGTTFDVQVSADGSGTLGLNLKSSGTGIQDAAGNLLSGGFTGQTYTIQPAPATYGFTSVTNLAPLTSQPDATKGRPQAKVFTNAGRHWAIIANATGTHLWRLDGTSWTHILRLSTRNTRADCIVAGNVTHILLFGGKNSELVSVEYVAATNTYQPWTPRKTKADLVLDDGVETATLALDGTGRMWVASDAVTDIRVRYSDAPYTTWSAPVTIASGINEDDVCAVIAMPRTGQIGVLWGNQQTRRFGFKTHTNEQEPAVWSADEVPASQSALNEGAGMADDHLDMKIASDGTLFCAVKTGYNEAGFPQIALLVRRPAGTWDKLYSVSETGTAPIVLVNEALGKVKVIYTSQTYGGDILYRESSTSSIAFGPELTLIRGTNNYATSSHQLYASEVVVLAANSQQTVGVLASDEAAPTGSGDALAASQLQAAPSTDMQAYPNPFSAKASIRFALAADGPYTFTLYDSQMIRQVYQIQGTARAGNQNIVEIAGAGLKRGFYYARLQTQESVQTLRLLLEK